MKIQKIKLGENKYTWLVIGNDYLPIPTIQEFIRYLTNIEKSPNTIRAYAHHLKLYWEFLTEINASWNKVSLSELAEFVRWLRANNNKIIVIDETVSTRKETTINTILAALASFYRYYSQLGKTDIQLTCYKNNHRKAYKSLLHHISKSKPSKQRIIKLKTIKTIPKTLQQEQVEALLDACVSHRDKFLMSLLYETGMRIGQALSLYHEDICSWNNEIILTPRTNLENGARSKSRKTYTVHVTAELMSLYNKYYYEEVGALQSDFVFIQTHGHRQGKPLAYSAIKSLFERMSKKLGFHATAHMFRHTHATELIRNGWDSAYVQKRLGHAHVQTTLDIYAHLENKDLKKSFDEYQNNKNNGVK